MSDSSRETVLKVRELTKTYPTGDEALRGVSFDVGGSEIVAVVGPSGAGKSTLIKCINRLVEPTSGQIWLDGVEITGLSEKKLRQQRRNMGMIFQEFNLVERLSVMENVLSGRLGYTSNWKAFRRSFNEDEIEDAFRILERVGLEDYVNKRADELSGGQRQRVGIARAVIQHPKILLVDEPTSSLDPETSRSVMELLTDIAESDDIPVLLNIHEVDLAREFSERILGLHRGVFVFDGPPESLDGDALDRIYRAGDGSPERVGTPAARDSSALSREIRE